MRFLIANSDYGEFLRWLYAQHPGLAQRSYERQMAARMESLFGVADFYSRNLRRLGHQACDVHVNNRCAQRAWAREHGLKLPPGGRWRRRFSRVAPRCGRWLTGRTRGGAAGSEWLFEVLAAQVEHYRPDVVLNQALETVPAQFWRGLRRHIGLLVGQHPATPLPADQALDSYDLIVSSFGPTVAALRRRRVRAALHRLAFEPDVLDDLPPPEACHELTFVGSLGCFHRSRIELLEALAGRFPQMRVWAPSVAHLPANSALRRRYAGPAWGRQMYRVLRQSKMTVNHHGDVPGYANNLRLYEATGVGTLLLTDHKPNLPELFDPQREVVAYRNAAECLALIARYLRDEPARAALARAGQQRTLREHTYRRRMRELVELALAGAR